MKDRGRVEPYRLLPGDVLLAARGARSDAAVVPDTGDVPLFASSNVIAIRLDGSLSPDLLAAFLLCASGEAELARLRWGTTVPALSAGRVGEIKVRLPDKDNQTRLAELVQAERDAREAAEALAALRQEAALLLVDEALTAA